MVDGLCAHLFADYLRQKLERNGALWPMLRVEKIDVFFLMVPGYVKGLGARDPDLAPRTLPSRNIKMNGDHSMCTPCTLGKGTTAHFSYDILCPRQAKSRNTLFPRPGYDIDTVLFRSRGTAPLCRRPRQRPRCRTRRGATN